MWIVRWILIAIIVLVIIGFAMQNTSQTASVEFIKWRTINLPLWVIMYSSFAFGILFWLVVSIVHIISLKNENRKCKKENRKLRAELDSLRNAAVDDTFTDVESPRSRPTGDEE